MIKICWNISLGKYQVFNSENISKVFVSYVACFFFIPMIIHIFFPQVLNAQFNGMENYVPLVFIIIFWILIFFLTKLLKFFSFSIKPIFPSLLDYRILNYFLIILFLILSIVFNMNYDLGFRQTGTNLSQTPIWVSF